MAEIPQDLCVALTRGDVHEHGVGERLFGHGAVDGWLRADFEYHLQEYIVAACERRK